MRVRVSRLTVYSVAAMIACLATVPLAASATSRASMKRRSEERWVRGPDGDQLPRRPRAERVSEDRSVPVARGGG